MTQQDRPRTSRGHYGGGRPMPHFENNENIQVQINYPSDRPTTRHENRKPMIIRQEVGEKEHTIPRPPPGMPQREETFISQQNQSPRRRRYSTTTKKDIETDEPILSEMYNSNFQNLQFDQTTTKANSKLKTQGERKSSLYNNDTILTNPKDPIEIMNNEAIDRPVSSRLSKFSSPLPPISFKMSISQETSTSPNIDESVILVSKLSKFNLSETIEESKNIDNNVLIAIRLPNGETIKKSFLKTDLIINILKYASEVSNLDFLNQDINLLEMPKTIINDLYKSIEFYGLKNRTMLHIICKTTSSS